MKKNGFIATSLIYSFFLIFITLFLTIIADYLQNKVLLNTIEKEIKDEINDSMGIRDFEVGDILVFAPGEYNDNYSNVLSDTESWVISRVYIDNTNQTNSYLNLNSFNTYTQEGIECLKVQDIYDDLFPFGYLNDTYLNKILYNFNKDTYKINEIEYEKTNRIINSTNINNYLNENLGLCRKRIKLIIGTDRLKKDTATLGDSITITGVL